MTDAPTRDRVPATPGIERLVSGLERLAKEEDRAALAGLRRGLGKEHAPPAEVLRVVVPLLPAGQVAARDKRLAFLLAPLFALHPEPWDSDDAKPWTSNFGASLRRLAERTDGGGPERRFMALLDADADDLGPHLRRLVSVLASARPPIPVDWRQLARDLRAWEHPDRPVQKRWAESFWAISGEPADAAEMGRSEDGDRDESA